MKKRVVLTGLGIVAPSGTDLGTFWKNISQGVARVKKVTNFDVSQFLSQIAAQVEDFDPARYGMSPEIAQRMDRYVQFSIAAAESTKFTSLILINLLW